jgi:uncharacterized secreted repeat protein (TIGR03808 family)
MIRLTRRHLLSGAAALAALVPARAMAQLEAAIGHGFANAADFGVLPDGTDQSEAMRGAVAAASAAGLPLYLPAGTYAMNQIELPSAMTLFGVRGATTLVSTISAPVITAYSSRAVSVRDLVVDGSGDGANAESQGLLVFANCDELELEGLQLSNGSFSGVRLDRCSGRVENLAVSGFSDGIFSYEGRGLVLAHNRISDCANGGIRVWGPGEGDTAYDGTIVSENDISGIGSTSGNGQNGNGINVYRADGVTVRGNRLRNCDFSAIRLNTTNDTIVSGNTCLDSGEVAIFSEFGFSGSVIADNIVDRAAQGISMTNFDQNGRLATCTGNIVRNIAARSLVNPDTTPAGIFAEADAIIANNVVESVPGVGIGAGWGPYLRDVVISSNLIRDADIGIAVSVAEGAGSATVTGNRIVSARRAAIAGTAWQDVVTDDLARDAGQFSGVVVTGNSAG